jgi:arsenate reductase (thioredoxin)
MSAPTTVPSVLFVCVHNGGRSRIAAAFLTHLAGGRVEVRSAGVAASADAVNPAVVAAMPRRSSTATRPA